MVSVQILHEIESLINNIDALKHCNKFCLGFLLTVKDFN